MNYSELEKVEKEYIAAATQYILENKKFIEGKDIPVDRSTSYEIDFIDGNSIVHYKMIDHYCGDDRTQERKDNILNFTVADLYNMTEIIREKKNYKD